MGKKIFEMQIEEQKRAHGDSAVAPSAAKLFPPLHHLNFASLLELDKNHLAVRVQCSCSDPRIGELGGREMS